VTKADLVDEISGKTRISKSETATIVDQLLNAISRALSEGKHIEIRGFGTSFAGTMTSNELKGAVRG